MAAWCQPCKSFHAADEPHTRPQPLPKDESAYISPEEKKVYGECNFCGKKDNQIVQGPAVAICKDCIALCADIVGYVPPGMVPEVSARYTVRIKLLEERCKRAVEILNGEP